MHRPLYLHNSSYVSNSSSRSFSWCWISDFHHCVRLLRYSNLLCFQARSKVREIIRTTRWNQLMSYVLSFVFRSKKPMNLNVEVRFLSVVDYPNFLVGLKAIYKIMNFAWRSCDYITVKNLDSIWNIITFEEFRINLTIIRQIIEYLFITSFPRI